MCDEPINPEVQWRQLQEVLLGHLCGAGVPLWPGADGLTLADVLHTYQSAAAAGHVPGREQLLAEHPHLEQALSAFFTGKANPGSGSVPP